ncbi:metallophosphoesterase [Parapedobacter sp. SGR-10]|nr:metallophosphoesterase [Parapedobacter sp. SGR-10]
MNMIKIHRILIALILAFVSLNYSCKDTTIPGGKDDGTELPAAINLTNLKVESVYNVSLSSELSIKGQGFKNDDIVSFVPKGNIGTAIDIPIKSVSNEGILLTYSTELKSGSYTVILKRGNYSRQLGQTTVNFVINPNIPDIAGKNIKGTVFSNGQGVANVVVSDGYDVAKTDQNGIYYLASNKQTGYVFVSVPGNYEVVSTNNNLPVFYQYLNAGTDIVEVKDFELKPVNNDNHIVLAMADLHLANRNEDLTQFQNGFVADVNQQIASYQGQGKKVYGLTLGDLTWDTYWYSNSFMLPEYVKQISKVNAPVFNIMGNHDNDPYFANDWSAENAYRRTLGPTYYSFNLGKIHYIVLDNTEYINTGGASGVVGNRNYNAKFSDQQLSWLEKDLATIDASTPIVIATHIQVHNAPAANGTLPGFRTSNGQQLINLLSQFNEVHILTGHTHINYRVPHNTKLMEHNTAAICATWWWTGRTGYSDNHIAPDGSPGGYSVWEMTGKDIKWHYKSIGYDKDYQFRSYDLNNVHITASQYASSAKTEFQSMVPQYAFDFANENKNNEVLINIWGYDPQWTVTVTESGNPLTVTRVNSRDPLHIISYSMKRLNVNAEPTFDSTNTSHMFKVKASAANTTLDIQVKDRFGNIYTETMTRPKDFTYNMK